MTTYSAVAPSYLLMDHQDSGVSSKGIVPVSNGINQKTGNLNLYELLPKEGDSMVVMNRGTHYEVRYHQWREPPLTLTDEDIQSLTEGRITFN